jgi:hypothetical protein
MEEAVPNPTVSRFFLVAAREPMRHHDSYCPRGFTVLFPPSKGFLSTVPADSSRLWIFWGLFCNFF